MSVVLIFMLQAEPDNAIICTGRDTLLVTGPV